MVKSNISLTKDGYQTLNASFNSDAILVPGNLIAVQPVWTGDAEGDLWIQQSMDRETWQNIDVINDNGVAVDGYSISGAGYTMYELMGDAEGFIRISYTSTSGGGGLNWYVICKSDSGNRSIRQRSGVSYWRRNIPEIA